MERWRSVVRLVSPGEAALVAALLAFAGWELPHVAGEPAGDLMWLLITTVIPILSLLWRCSHPLSVAVVVASLFAIYPIPDANSPEVLTQGITLLVALYSVGAHATRRSSIVGLALGCVAGGVHAVLLAEYSLSSALAASAWALLPWGVGVGVRTREQRAASAEEVASTAQLRLLEVEAETVAAERLRIGRELHDVVAHAVTVMMLQARGGRCCLDTDPQSSREAFDAVEELGSEALRELRQMLSVLSLDLAEPADPRPGLADVPRLVGSVRRAGLVVDLTIEGESQPLSAGVDVTAYRVLQEALTNALRHGAGSATARISHRPDAVEIELSNPVGQVVGPVLGSGRGIVGARERVTLFGGTLETRQCDDRFILSAILPRDRGTS